MSIANEIINLQEKLASDRVVTERVWQEIAEVMYPGHNNFFDTKSLPGEKQTEKIISSSAISARHKCAAALDATGTPSSAIWHRLTSLDPRILNDKPSMVYLDTVNDILFKKRYSAKSNFANENHMVIESAITFGTGVMITEDLKNGEVGYRCGFIGEFYLMENKLGIIDYVIRKYRRTARQAQQMFGDNLPVAIKQAAEKNPIQEFDFLHCVKPNEDRKHNNNTYKGMAYSSYHIACEDNYFIEEGGFRTFPFHIHRYVVAPNEVYGRGPGWFALAETKMLNEITKDDLRARHMSTNPPLLVANERGLRTPDLTPSAVNYGALDANGRPLIVPFNQQARVDISSDSINRSIEIINDIFLVTLFQILVNAPAMTATEVLERAQEKATLLAPALSRAQTEFYSTIIEREIDILEYNGQLPTRPDLMLQLGSEYAVEYSAPINLMQKAGKALAAKRFIESILPLAQFNPDILQRINFEEYVKILQEAEGVEAALVLSDEEYADKLKRKEQQAQLAQIMQAAPGVSQSIKNIAEAQNIAQ